MTDLLIKFCKYHNISPAAFAALNYIAQRHEGLPSKEILDEGLQARVILATDKNIYLTERGKLFMKAFIRFKNVLSLPI